MSVELLETQLSLLASPLHQALFSCNGVCRAQPFLFLLLSLISGVFDIFDRENNSLNIKRNAWEYIEIWFSVTVKSPDSVQLPRNGQERTQALLEG